MDIPSQLLCTFSTLKGYPSDIDSIFKTYENVSDHVFVLQNVDNYQEIFLTYNVWGRSNVRHPKTISVHRKKNMNVIYSINGLNKLVEQENGIPSFDKKVDWTKYRNSIIITAGADLKIIPTRLLTIFFV